MASNFVLAKGLPEDILAFTTTKDGGYSKKKFATLNCGLFTDDDISDVLKNIEMVKSNLNICKLSLLKQVHGNIVLNVTTHNFSETYLSEGDGLFTIEKGIALGVVTADCFPVLLAGNIGIAALHCGWRSLNSDIIENAIKLFKENNDYPEYAYVGAGICNDCYEIKDDMVPELNIRYSPETALKPIGNNSYKLDLKKLVKNALDINKIVKYSFMEYSSCCSDMFYSYRRDKGVTGRMLSAIIRRTL